VVASLAIFNGLYPVITRSSGSITSAATKLDDRIKSRIEIIHVSDNSTTVDLWVKNVGTTKIDDIGKSDIFFGPEDNFARITYGGGTPPYWDYQIEGGYSQWKQTITINVNVYLISPLSSNTTYMAKMIIPNGISDETTFGVD
jgi:flagellar protein FlaG